jgi:hypothetical protein
LGHNELNGNFRLESCYAGVTVRREKRKTIRPEFAGPLALSRCGCMPGDSECRDPYKGGEPV